MHIKLLNVINSNSKSYYCNTVLLISVLFTAASNEYLTVIFNFLDKYFY